MLVYESYVKKYYVRTITQLTSGIHPIDSIDILPGSSVLHVLDNLSVTNDIHMVPSADNPLFNHLPQLKYLTHKIRHYEDIDEQYIKGIILTQGGITKDILEYRKQHGTEFKYVDDISRVPINRNAILIISYNSLFRAKFSGVLSSVRRFNYVFANVIKNVNSNPERYHYIHIPLNTIRFEKGDFLLAMQGFSRTTIRYPEVPAYLFTLHFLGYFHAKCKDSIFELFDENILDKIVFILTCNDKCIFYRLSDLIKLNEKSSIYNKLLLLINELTSINLFEDEEIGEKIDNTSEIIVEEKIISIPNNTTRNMPIFKEPKPKEEHNNFLKSQVEEIDKQAESVIINSDYLTPAQKTRVLKVAKKYKEIKITNTKDNTEQELTIEQLLTQPIDQKLEKNSLDFLEDSIIDKSMIESSIVKFDKEYMEKTFKRDLVSCLVSFNSHGMFLTDIKETYERSELNRTVNYNVKYEDINGKSHTIKFTLPEVDKNGHCLLNGSLKTMKKQRVNLPICKVNALRVMLSSEYTKAPVERNTSIANSFFPHINKIILSNSDKIDVTYKEAKLPDNVILPYEYTAISRKFDTLTINKDIKFIFDYNKRPVSEKLLSDESQYGIYIGSNKDSTIMYFMDNTCTVTILKGRGRTTRTTLLSILSEELNIPIKPVNEYVTIKLLNYKIPVIFILCYKYGFTHMLNYLNLNYEIFNSNMRIPINPSKCKIVFKDKTIVFDKTPFVSSLLFCGFSTFNLSEYYLEEMDETETYHQIAMEKQLAFNYIRGIDNFFDLFIDPITKDTLFQMNEPTNVKDLLIRATLLITTEDHQPASAAANFKFRSYEKMASVVYNELSRSLVTYKGNNVGSGSFFVNPYAIKQRILKDQLMTNLDVLNPIHDIKQTCAYSHLGEGGRASDTFMISDRKFPNDGYGTISELNIDSGSVGINGFTPMNPNILNTRGLTTPIDKDKIDPAQLLSVTSLLVPGATNDDRYAIR